MKVDMKIKFRRFIPIIQTKTSPHGITLLSSFKFKLIIAGIMFGGGVDYFEKKQKFSLNLGIFDYCTLGIPFLISFGWAWAKHHANPLVKYGLGFLIGLVHIPVIIKRPVFSKVCYLPIFSENSTEPVNYNNMKALQALIKLNAGGVTRRLEKTEEGKTLLGKIMATPINMSL